MLYNDSEQKITKANDSHQLVKVQLCNPPTETRGTTKAFFSKTLNKSRVEMFICFTCSNLSEPFVVGCGYLILNE